MGEQDNKNSLHDRHKERIRKRYLSDGSFDNFQEHEMLEMLLNYSIVRGNTNEIAHRLIDRFGSLDGVFEARFEELMKIDGIGERSATLIKMQYDLFRAYLTGKYDVKNKLYSEELAVKYLKGLFFGKQQEFLYLICLDDKGKVIKVRFISYGIGELSVDYREIMSEVLATNASGVVLAHNHPNGILRASQEDINETQEVEKFLSKVSVRLVDHFVFCDDEYISILNTHSFNLKKI